MASMAQLRYSPLAAHSRADPGNRGFRFGSNSQVVPFLNSSTFLAPQSLSLCTQAKPPNPESLRKLQLCYAAGGGDDGAGGHHGGGGGGDSDDDSSSGGNSFGPVGGFLSGWRSRVAADPQFPFKVLMEELVGVTACVIGDMASRPNFGLNELDFVFSTLVVGSILNFVLMYLLAPTMTSAASGLPGIFANCPASHMFEPGPYGLINRVGTFVYKGTLFAGVGFAAGLAGTVLSNGLIKLRKMMDPEFETPNKAPPTLLNSMTWAAHMGISSNLRYQTLNGIEFLLAKGFPPFLFKSSVVVLRCLNNVVGGMSFVMLARLTGSQSVSEEKMVAAIATVPAAGANGNASDGVKLVHHEEEEGDQNSAPLK